MATLISDRRLYLTADRSLVVEAGDPAASWLLVAAGAVIDADDVARYGLHHAGGKITVPPPKAPAADPEPAEPKPAPKRRRG
jgi:hypothetical protein